MAESLLQNDNQYLFLFFTIATVILYLGPHFFFPGLSPEAGVPVITTRYGDIRGTSVQSRDGRRIFAYKGIPFAKPPVGQLRFAQTEPWTDDYDGVLDATSDPPHCPQPELIPFRGIGDEDCLKLNIYVPNLKSEEIRSLPVLVWIHGGSFLDGEGSSRLYGPKYLMDRDIILVSIQYRVGILGGLNLGMESSPGNQGLWDQREALKWIRKNIEAFGGDANRVTLAGTSAGAMSAIAHAVSKQSKGLFQAIISLSGVLHSSLLYQERSIPTYHRDVVKALGCGDEGSKESDIISCMQSLDVADLLDKNTFFDQCNLFQGFSIAPATWGPSLDVQSTKKPFFSDNPSNLVEQGKLHDVAYLIGITKEDGLFYTGALHNRPDIEDHLRNNWDDCMTTNLFGKRLEHVTSKDVELLRTIEKFYFGEKRTEFNPETFSNVTDLFTDFAFAFPADLTVRSATRHLKSKVYYHRLDISEGFSNFNLYGLSSWSYLAGIVKFFLRIYPKARGCSHGDEIKYLFNFIGPSNLHSDQELQMSKVLVDLMANFVTFHDPTPVNKDGGLVGEALKHVGTEWKPVSKQEQDTMIMPVVLDKGTIINDKVDAQFMERISFIRDKIYQPLRRLYDVD